jgi:hypothetical protein
MFLFVWFGLFNVAATVQHSDFTLSLISIVRDRSIAVRAKAPSAGAATHDECPLLGEVPVL